MTDEKTVEGKKLDNIMDKIQDLYFADSVLDTVWLTLKKEIEAYKDEEVEKEREKYEVKVLKGIQRDLLKRGVAFYHPKLNGGIQGFKVNQITLNEIL